MAPPQSFKLTYFACPGRAECARLMLNHGSVEWQDHIMPVPWAIWQTAGLFGMYKEDDQLLMKHQTVDDSQRTWEEAKSDFPYGKLPTLEVDGKVLAESDAIERYIAKLVGLYPTDTWEAAKVDELTAFLHDVREQFANCHFLEPEARLKGRLALTTGQGKFMFEKLASMLEVAGGDHFIGGELTWADFKVYDVTSFLISGYMDGVPQNLMEPYPVLKQFHARMAALPSIAKFYEEVETGVRVPHKRLPVCSDNQ